MPLRPPIAVYVNTWNRSEMAVATLRRYGAAAKLGYSLTVIDDHSDESDHAKIAAACGGLMIRLDRHSGAGIARCRAMEHFIGSNADFAFFLDSDLEFKPGFDREGFALWLSVRYAHWPSIGSSYRSSDPKHLADDREMDRYVLNHASTGAFLIMDRATVMLVLREMTAKMWEADGWDWFMSLIVPCCVKPKLSLVRHLGGPGSIHNTEGKESGYGFDQLR